VILGLAVNQPEVAGWVLQHSPLMVDGDLVDAAGASNAATQLYVANRGALRRSIAAIAEVGAPEGRDA
jgi:uncharacterized protein (DUF2336 family)